MTSPYINNKTYFTVLFLCRLWPTNPLSPMYLQSIPFAFATYIIERDLPLLWCPPPPKDEQGMGRWLSFSNACFLRNKDDTVSAELRDIVGNVAARAGLSVVVLPAELEKVR